MSRRDTIIVAALINAGLLIILFVSALKNPSPSETLVMAPESLSHHSLETSIKSDVKTVMGDEVDQVLSQYSKQNPLQPAPVTLVAETPVAVENQQVVAVATPTENFVDDLNALTKATEQVATQDVSVVTAPFATFVEVKVKKGDVLEKIARGHQCSVQEIMKVNKLSSTNLKIGQVLRIPSKLLAGPSAIKNQTPASTTDSAFKYYVVKSGDNPWTIAVKNHIKVEELLKLNNMDEAKARKLKPGDQIRIR
jgi:LysM repeat protein